MIPFSIYVVEDEVSIRKAIYYELKKEYQVKEFECAEEALEEIRESRPDLVLMDIKLPGMSGIEALKEIKSFDPGILVIMSTADDDINSVILAMKMGAYDYIVKPFQMDKIKAGLKNALETIRMSKEIQLLQEKYLKENIPGFIAESDSIQEVMQVVGKVAQSQAPVLILGESGTGKELIANTIHCKSPNFRGPFVAINCAAIPNNLIESELFGYEKGAFSGAASTGKKGQIELSGGGTLFLDEVGDLSHESQAKLLRFLESGEFYRVGGCKKIAIQTRIISATNKDIEEMVENGLFRDDLYYRLAIIKVEVPSLNDRKEDIIPITRYFLLKLGHTYGKKFHEIAPEVERFLLEHDWHGNIRELRNLIEKGVIMGNGPVLTMNDLGLNKPRAFHSLLEGKNGTPNEKESLFPPLPENGIDLEAMEDHFLRESIRKSGGNDAKAAKLLGLNYYAFRYRKKKLGEKTSP